MTNIETSRLLLEAEKLIMKRHPHKTEFYRQLESGELAKRLNVIGKPFDPDGRVKWMLEIKALKDAGAL